MNIMQKAFRRAGIVAAATDIALIVTASDEKPAKATKKPKPSAAKAAKKAKVAVEPAPLKKPETRLRPKAWAAKILVPEPSPAAPLKNWEPVIPKKEGHARKEVPSDSSGYPTLAVTAYVRFLIPAGSKIEFDGSKAVRISVPLGDGPMLIISGDPNMLGSIDTSRGACLVQGQFTAKRSKSHPKALDSASLVLGASSRIPHFELQQLQGHPHIAANWGKGWRKAVHGCVIQVVKIEDAAEQLAA